MTFPVLSVLLAASLLAAQPSASAGEVGLAFGSGRSSSADVVAQAPELCDSSGVTQFSDVGSGDYGSAYILCMRALGLSVGTGGGEFGAEGILTRGQMASFLVRLWRDVLGRSCPEGGTPFGDVGGNSHEDNIACLYNLGVAKGTTVSTYSPQDTLTMQQISRFLMRLYEKAGNSCPDRASEVDEAASCLLALNVVPDAGEARSSIAVTRARMAVYVVGLWHNLSGRGLPPEPPRPGFRDAMKPIPADLAIEANVVTTGRMEIPVYICAPANRYRVAHLRTAVAELNREVGPFFAEQSSGEVDLRLTVGGIVSPPNIDWATLIFRSSGEVDLCEEAAIEQEGHRQGYVLVDVVGIYGLLGYAYTGLGPAVQPMQDDFENTYGSDARYFDTFAHEVGHSRFGFCHNHETYQGGLRCPLFAYHNANVFDPHDDSLMSYSGTDNLDTTHIACAHRAQAGWPPGPPLPSGQRCTGSGPGPQPTSVPNRPRDLSVTPGDGQLVVRWAAPAPPAGERWQWLSGYTVSFDNGQGDSGRRNVSDTRVIIASLTNGVEYTIEVTATNEIGAGPAAVARGTPGGDTTGVPGPPTAAVVEGDRELTVSWLAPSDDGGAPVTGYTIRSGDGSINTAVGASTRTYRIGGLVNGRSYTISVYAQNRNGMSQTPATVTATPMATHQVPDAPVVTVEGPVEGNAIVAGWYANDNGSRIDQWELSVDTIAFFDTFSGEVSTTSWYGWEPGAYTVRVRAHNVAGWSGWGSDTLTIWQAPDIPVVTAWSVDDTLVASWYANDNGSPINGWWVYALDQWGTEYPSTVSAASTTTYTWTDLAPGDYTVHVSASNEGGWSDDGISNAVTVERTIPPPPSSVWLVDVGETWFTVAWSPVTSAYKYDFDYRLQGPQRGRVGGGGGPFETTLQLTGLNSDSTYTFRVRSCNDLQRHGDYGDQACGTVWTDINVTTDPEVQVPDVPMVTASVSRSNDIQSIWVSWSANDNGSSIIEWSFACPSGYRARSVRGTTTTYSWTPDGEGDYSCDVRARNSAGWSDWGTSNTVSVVPIPEVPDAPVVTASVSGRSITASWSADDNGSPIDQWEIGGVSRTVSSGTTIYRWTDQQSGDYVVRVRAHNSAGWSDWGTSNTVTVQPPTVILSRGDPGPTVAPRQGDIPCGRSSPDCRWLSIELRNFTPGRYRVYCVHDGFDSFSAGYWEDFMLTVGSDGRATSTRGCYINIAKAEGRGVIVRVGEASQAQGSSRWQSNWLR